MILWIDAQLSPAVAPWINVTFDIQTHAVRDLGLRDAKDLQIFRAAREKKTVIMTKDAEHGREKSECRFVCVRPDKMKGELWD